MPSFLTVLYVLSIALYIWRRPRWRTIGPSLLDSYLFGIGLFVVGSILEHFLQPSPYATEVLEISLVAGVAGSLAGCFAGVLIQSSVASMNFIQGVKSLRGQPGDHFSITMGLVLCLLVNVWFLTQALSDEHLRSLLFGAIFNGEESFTQARLIMSAGTEHYFAPGYVKQFRDIGIPILCSAALLCHGTYQNKILFYSTIIVTIVAMFISGQRSILVIFALCLGGAFILDWGVLQQHRLMPVKVAVLVLAVLGLLVILMTQMLGRLNAPLLPSHHPSTHVAEPQKAFKSNRLKAVQKDVQKEEVLRAFAAIALRAVVAPPQENTASYHIWGHAAPVYGRGWLTDLASILPGTQRGLSNELASEPGGVASLGNSPLGLPADLFYNWGWFGVLFFAPLFSILFLLLDICLVRTNSPLLIASKLLMFFSIPMMYSPFLFLLYGGAVTIALVVYVRFLQMWIIRRVLPSSA